MNVVGSHSSMPRVAPARERGLKFAKSSHKDRATCVAPARERGLKWSFAKAKNRKTSRSREGAWIEMPSSPPQH